MHEAKGRSYSVQAPCKGNAQPWDGKNMQAKRITIKPPRRLSRLEGVPKQNLTASALKRISHGHTVHRAIGVRTPIFLRCMLGILCHQHRSWCMHALSH